MHAVANDNQNRLLQYKKALMHAIMTPKPLGVIFITPGIMFLNTHVVSLI